MKALRAESLVVAYLTQISESLTKMKCRDIIKMDYVALGIPLELFFICVIIIQEERSGYHVEL